MNETKKVSQTVKFNLAVGDAKPGPSLAPILGQSQISIQVFCKEFNELTSRLNDGTKLPVKIKKFEDKSFKIYYQTPSLNYIFEQIIMNRIDSKDSEDFSFVTIHEIIDMLNVLKTFYSQEKISLKDDKFYFKLILSFLLSKKVRLI